MAKKPSLLDAVKQTPRRNSGTRPWHYSLTPEQSKEFFEFIEGIRVTPEAERPTYVDTLPLIKQYIGKPISINVLRDYILGR